MPTATEAFSARPNVRGRIVLTLGEQSIENNTSKLRTQLICEETAQQSSWHLDNNLAWSLSGIPGGTYSGTWAFDFRPAGNQGYTLLDNVRTLTHNADGTLSVAVTSSVAGDILGSTSPSINYTLPRIARGPRLKYEGVYKNTVAFIKLDGVYKIAIPFTKIDGAYKIGGG